MIDLRYVALRLSSVSAQILRLPQQNPQLTVSPSSPRSTCDQSQVEYVDWFNQRRLHGELGHVTPAEREVAYSAAEPPASLQKTN